MNKIFKLRYFMCARFDSQHLLKLLIVFNVSLGIYLLFLSTNHRRYNEYPNTQRDSVLEQASQHDINQNVKIEVGHANSVKDVKSIVNRISVDKPVPLEIITNIDNKAKISKPVGSVDNNNNNDQASDVEKVYDSNNKLVVQETDNAPEASYKRIDEDDKTLDEIDNLRIEMISKTGNSNSIIHDLEFSQESKTKTNTNDLRSIDKSDKSVDSNKDVINQILDHNLHINKNSSKVIVPETVNAESAWWSSETRGKYTVLQDYIQGSLQPEPDMRSITLTTQGTPEFLHHALQLCDRWDGFISLSVYAPGTDFKLAVNMIYYLRQCGSKCIGERIYWHMVYDKTFAPSNLSVPASYLETSNFDCNIPLSESMKLLNLNTDFRKSKSLPYPINVLRNSARLASKTKYLLASDIELYPSVGIVSAFFDLLDREKQGKVPLINTKNPHVYVLPIFEVKANQSPPKNKKELSKLFATREAIFFHRYVCDLCQNFPDRDVWIKQKPFNNTLNVFRSTRRLRERNQWEPLYIGTNAEPFYDERLTWDGKRDKMSQMYEMCLLKYDMLVLDNAFLVHAPGIKYYSAKDDTKRLPFISFNQKVHNSLLAQLRKKYGTNNKC